MSDLQESKDPQERQVGQVFTHLEYENLVTALNLALEAQVSTTLPYNALIGYLDAQKDHPRALALYLPIVERMEAYSSEQLAGRRGYELAERINALGTEYLQLKQFAESAAAYQKTLQVLLQVTHIDEQSRDLLEARTYHGLGRVAQEQRQFPQAEHYYQQALQLFIEYNDRYSQAGTYHQLGWVAQEQRQFPQAREYFLRALKTFVAYQDDFNSGIVLRSLARLWQASGDAGIPTAVAPILSVSPTEAEALLRERLGDEGGQGNG